ncbi:alpha/beta fold hydrolase [Pseudonocardia xishanensis]|uniref:Alpha/beta fold hydrolase n=1 Tax=Pseudonocardia xishanensis TaxID=630995 RepID=A0ABP8S610_9PSEU
MSTPTMIETRTVSTWGDQIRLQVKVFGTGPALIYLHPLGGFVRDDFLDELARTHTVYAPELPGTSADDPFAIHKVDDIFDLVLVYEEALRKLGVHGAPVIGQSFGGMLAAELASCFPDLFGQVALLGPAGLWFTDKPWTLEVLTGPPSNLPSLLFSDPSADRPRAMLALPEDATAAVDALAHLTWTMGCGAKFLWPVPDRGLVRRLHRISAPVLVVWGEDDRIIPSSYAHEYGKRIAGSTVHVLPGSGHIPQVEQMEATLELVSAFLAGR